MLLQVSETIPVAMHQAKESESVSVISKAPENFSGGNHPDYIYWGENKSINIDVGVPRYKDVAMF